MSILFKSEWFNYLYLELIVCPLIVVQSKILLALFLSEDEVTI